MSQTWTEYRLDDIEKHTIQRGLHLLLTDPNSPLTSYEMTAANSLMQRLEPVSA